MAIGPEEKELLASCPDLAEGLKIFNVIEETKSMLKMLDGILMNDDVISAEFPRKDLKRMRLVAKKNSELIAKLYETYRSLSDILLDETE